MFPSLHDDTGVGFLSLLLLQSCWEIPTFPQYSLWSSCLFQQKRTLNWLHMYCYVRMNFGMLLQGWSYFQFIWYLNPEQMVWISWVIQKPAAASSVGARPGSSSLSSDVETKWSIMSEFSPSLACLWGEGWLVWAAHHSWMTQAKPSEGVSSSESSTKHTAVISAARTGYYIRVWVTQFHHRPHEASAD